MPDILNLLIKKFEEDYRSYSYVMKANHDDDSHIDLILRYYYMAPGFVRMEMIKPFRGAVIAYDPERGTAHVRPFGGVKSFVLELEPGSRLIRGPQDHRVDESDILTLLRTVKDLARKGEVVVNKRKGIIVITVRGKGGHVVRKRIGSFVLQFKERGFIPIYAASYDEEGEFIEEVFFEDFKSPLPLGKDFFDLKR